MTDAPDVSPNLSLPFYQTKQNEFEVQHNEALMMLDALAMLSVIDRDLAEPPASPAQGDRYLVGEGATGGFAGQDNRIAQYDIGGWNFHAPKVGWTCYVQDERTLLAWDGSAWQPALDGLGGASELQNMALLGIGTEADAVNPLAAKLNNVLWTARTAAEGGDGTLRYKLSKESADKTLSLLFQDNYSGRAEIGLTGDDDFHFKVSSDGTNWLEAIRIDRVTGKVVFPAPGGPREMLAANRTYYVRTDGSDSNDGLDNTSGRAFATLQKAWDRVAQLDLGIYTATIQIGDGTYTAGLDMTAVPVGTSPVVLRGNAGTPSNVLINVSGDGFVAHGPAQVIVKDMKMTCAGTCIYAIHPGAKMQFGNINFGVSGDHVRADGGSISATSNYTVSGGAQRHWLVNGLGSIGASFITVTFTGTPAFSGATFQFLGGGQMVLFSVALSGAATGPRYVGAANAVLNSFGAGTASTYFPGNSNGTLSSGAQQI